MRLADRRLDDGIPTALHGKPEATVIYNNLPQILLSGSARVEGGVEPQAEHADKRLKLALKIDRAMREQAPADWKGDQMREAQVQNALFRLLDENREATAALFEVVRNQPGY